MTNQVIPKAAIEAAVNAVLAETYGADWARRIATIAVEAAAPHMLAEAFEQGQTSGIRHATRMAAAVRLGRPDLPGPMSPNPYRRAL